MILSQKKIEEIAVAVIRDFQKSFFGSEADDPARFALPTPIDQFASDYLLMGSEPSKEEVKNDLLSIISELSTIAKKI